MIYTADGKIDLTPHNDEELTDQVINDEFLYGLLNNPRRLYEVVEDLFHYTPDQFDGLKSYVEE